MELSLYVFDRRGNNISNAMDDLIAEFDYLTARREFGFSQYRLSSSEEAQLHLRELFTLGYPDIVFQLKAFLLKHHLL
jgi:hypothetical protein